MRDKLLIDLINYDDVTKTEMRVAIFCRKQKISVWFLGQEAVRRADEGE